MLVKRLWKRAFALGGAGLLFGLGCGNAHAATTVLNETFNAASAQTWADNPAAGAASLSADNTFTVYNGNVSGLNAITNLGSGNLCYEHTSNNARGTGGSANASDFILMKQSGVPAVDIGTIASTNTLLFQYDLTQNATGVATGTLQQGNRQVGLECYKSTATRDGYAVRFAPRNDNTILQVGKISAATSAPPAIAGANFTALTAVSAPAMTNASKTLRIIVMLKPTVSGATTGNTNITYRVVNLTDGTDFIAPATGSIAFGPTVGTTIDHAGLVARQKTLCQVDNAKIVADPAPVLTALGGSVTVAQGGTYTDTAANIGGLDATDGILTTTSSPTAITVDTSAVNTSVVGTYTVTYSATNSLGSTGTTTRTVIVTDQTAPTITLNGANPVTVAQGGTYTDAGVTLSDNVDSPATLAGRLVTVNPVNTALVGQYTITYNVTDTANNAAVQVTRTVNVTDQTAPVITLVGSNSVTVAQGVTYTDAGVTLNDNVDSPATLAGNLVTVNPVDTNVLGDYTITYDVTDVAGNAAVQVTRTVYVTDQTAPNATSVAPATTGPTNATSVSFSVSFDEAVQNFNNAADVVANEAGVTHTGVSITGGPQNYTVTVTGISGDGTLSLAVSTASDVQDLGGNALASSATSADVTFDTTSPAPLLSSTAAATVGGAFTVTVNTGEDTTDFDASDLTATNGTVSNFTGTDSAYSFSLNPTATPVTVKINAGKYHDAAGNANTASSTLSRAFDSTLPSVLSVVPAPAISGPTNADSIAFTVTFDEPVQNVNNANDFLVLATGSVTTGTATVATVSTTVYTVTLPNIAGDGTVALQVNTASDIKDLTNNALGASIASTPITIDNTGADVQLSSSDPDPTNAAITVSVALSESVTTFDAGDISATNGVVSNFAGSGDTYSFTLAGTSDGSVSAVVNAGAFTDVAGNANTASNTLTRTLDTTAPVFGSVTAMPSEAHVGDEVTITFSSTDNIAGDPDVTVNGHPAVRGAKSIFTYTYTVSPSDPLGPATIQIDGVDTAGNAGSTTTSAALTVTVAPPSVPAVNGVGVCVLVLVLASAMILRVRKAH